MDKFENASSHLVIDKKHKLWMLFNGQTVTVFFSVLSFLLGTVITGVHYVERLDAVEKTQLTLSLQVTKAEEKMDKIEERRERDHNDTLNWQRVLLLELHQHRMSEPEVIVRYKGRKASKE